MDSERWRQVVRIYESAIARDPAARAAFVAEACGADRGLRAEVESLLAQDQAPVVIDRPLGAVAGSVLDTLAPNALLGPYRIEALLGAGGMGQVYRATDTRLNRTVAIKVLPHTLAGDPQFRARFDREAQAIAALAHPHICTLHDVGEHAGTSFLVLEYLEGETLAARLERGALPFEHALTCAIQIAEALDVAHRRGIVHRDLKPGNIMLVRAGGASSAFTVKLLDFGLAKPATPAVAGVGPSHVPTTPPALTAQGTILGTFQYMAPEQLEGREADPRTDIFTFGAVVYEMFTGQKAFEGKSHASLIGAIMHADPPPVSRHQPLTPSLVDHIVSTCLAKDADERWQSIRDVRRELRRIAAQSTTAPTRPRTTRVPRLVAVVAILLSVATGFIARSLLWTDARTPSGPVRLAFSSPGGQQFLSGGRQVVAISPDGSSIVYGRGTRMFARRLDGAVVTPIPGTESGGNVSTPFFSPDGRWLAFVSDDSVGPPTLMRIAVEGGAALAICETTGPVFGASWAPGDRVLFATDEGVFQVSAAGGEPRRIIEARQGETFYGPQLLPDGDHLLLSVTTHIGPDRWDRGQLVAHSLSSGERRVLVDGGSDGRYVGTGHLVYAVGTTLFAVPFDARALRVGGPPVAMERGVRRVGVPGMNTAAAFFAVSANGSFVYIPDAPNAFRQGLIDLNGRFEQLPLDDARLARTSPDGSQVVALHRSDQSLWIHQLSPPAAPRRIPAEGLNGNPQWSADGTRVTYRSFRQQQIGLFWQRADGSGGEEALLPPPAERSSRPVAWSRDGSTLFYLAGRKLWRWKRPGAPEALVDVPASDASISPGGKWVAYHVIEKGRTVPYIQSLDNAGLKFVVDKDGGVFPLWSPDGKKLFYVTDGEALVVVDVQTQPIVTFGRPAVVANDIRQEVTAAGRNYDIMPDGTRLLVQLRDRTNRTSEEVVVVLNWTQELKRRVRSE